MSIIDRRKNSRNKSVNNRKRFIDRYKEQIRKQVHSSGDKRSIKDMEQEKEVIIKDTKEPSFRHGKGGTKRQVHPGNEDFNKGDQIPKPYGGEEGTGHLGEEGIDEFEFMLSKEEFMQIYFDDLELPNFIKESMSNKDMKYARSGYSKKGPFSKLDLKKTFEQSLARRIASKAAYEDKDRKNPVFLDDEDLRYKLFTKQPKPSKQAVMILIMDVSGSMNKIKKDIAKRFYILLYLFLEKNYDNVDIVFLRHHTSAKEVDEQEFFYGRETGGTVVSSGLELAEDIIKKRYPSNEWNVYIAQASDGDNWNADNINCHNILTDSLLSIVRYFCYVEILPHRHQELWETYTGIDGMYDNFCMDCISCVEDTYAVFKKIFKRGK